MAVSAFDVFVGEKIHLAQANKLQHAHMQT